MYHNKTKRMTISNAKENVEKLGCSCIVGGLKLSFIVLPPFLPSLPSFLCWKLSSGLCTTKHRESNCPQTVNSTVNPDWHLVGTKQMSYFLSLILICLLLQVLKGPSYKLHIQVLLLFVLLPHGLYLVFQGFFQDVPSFQFCLPFPELLLFILQLNLCIVLLLRRNNEDESAQLSKLQ